MKICLRRFKIKLNKENKYVRKLSTLRKNTVCDELKWRILRTWIQYKASLYGEKLVNKIKWEYLK